MKNKKLSLIIILFILLAVVVLFTIIIKTNYLNKIVSKKGLSNKQQVEQLLVQKFNQPLDEDGLIIQEENDNYIVGQASVGEGGILIMAAKINNIWTLAYTGNAFVNCDELRVFYNFPKEFLPDYCDCNDKFYKEPYSERIQPKYCMNVYTNTQYGFNVKYSSNWMNNKTGEDNSLVSFYPDPKEVGTMEGVGFKIYFWQTFPDVGIISSINDLEIAVKQRYADDNPKVSVVKINGFDVVMAEDLPGYIDNESEAFVLLDDGLGILSFYPGGYVNLIEKI
ncbi:MAG: hypothetical protein PHN69_06805 [Candidatus Pacebacteria bacterium]|nr:hypothetical protein [Candidatus Paceibacterota bacterium]